MQTILYRERRIVITYQEWLGGDKLGINAFEKKYRFNDENFEEWLDRVSAGDEDLKQLIRDKKFIFGGRILSNRGTGKKATMMNCYSRGYVEDSLDDIMLANTEIAKTFQAQGGQGVSVSKIRPKGAGVNHGQYSSDGIVPFMELFNTTASSLNQGDGRRGALLISLDCWHKEAETFITIKSAQGKITKANLSLEIDDEFMQCVKEYYETGEEKVVHISRDYNGNKVEYDVCPIKLYKLMMQKAWEWGEPGCLFVNEFRNYNIMEFVDEYQVVTGNPCLHPDTPVLTDSGYVKIKDIGDNTKLVVYDSGKFTHQQVGKSFVTKTNCKTIRMVFKDYYSVEYELQVTEDHKIMDVSYGWTKAKDFKIGDFAISFNGLVELVRVEQGDTCDVYDLNVPTYHNFIANNVIVHNCGGVRLSIIIS